MTGEPSPGAPAPGEAVDVVVIGAGFGGLALGHRLARDGVDDIAILERGDGVGGTWRANTYPGAACDVPSHLYSLSFAPNPDWSRTYAGQPEILAYVERCYDEFGLRDKIRAGTTVTRVTWDALHGQWVVLDAAGGELRARALVSATGTFHTPVRPAIPGLDTFAGTVFHSARWRHDHPLDGRRVAVIGTGASAVQVVPAIAPQVAHLDLYQRTPAWIMPRRDEPFTAEQRHKFAADPAGAARHRSELYDAYEGSTAFLAGDPGAAVLTSVALRHLEEAVPDPKLRAALTPAYPIGCKRVLVSSAFYPAVQRDDVDLVTAGIERVTATGIVDRAGVHRECDTIVLCTGFRATDYLAGIDVRGRGGVRIHDVWGDTPRAYHGLMVPGFPNLFLMYGPNTNQGGNSILLILEAQAAFVADALRVLRERGAAGLDVTDDAMKRYTVELEAALRTTVWHDGCDSYFRSAAGDIVTQLPHTSRWYSAATAALDLGDFHVFPGS